MTSTSDRPPPAMAANCPACGGVIPRAVVKCPYCAAELDHKFWYPDQYQHPLVGKTVAVTAGRGPDVTGKVERVVGSRFGPLVILEGQPDVAWAVKDCKEL